MEMEIDDVDTREGEQQEKKRSENGLAEPMCGQVMRPEMIFKMYVKDDQSVIDIASAKHRLGVQKRSLKHAVVKLPTTSYLRQEIQERLCLINKATLLMDKQIQSLIN